MGHDIEIDVVGPEKVVQLIEADRAQPRFKLLHGGQHHCWRADEKVRATLAKPTPEMLPRSGLQRLGESGNL
jgi:hypothetical protein